MNHQDPELWARRRSSFGAAARAYAEHRPDYAADALTWVLDGPDRRVRDAIDLGAGTGAVSSGLVAAGVSVVAVEPDTAMAAELRSRLPGVPTVVGTAERIPVADASADAVVVGTAFHWFDHERAFPEIARVLRPGGVLGLLYSVDDETVPWVAELGRLSITSASTEPSEEAWPDHPAFAPFAEARFPHRQPRTAESLTATVGTNSHTIVVSDEERANTLARVRAFLDAQPETGQGTFDRPLVTVAARCRRL